eukprot:CAMPEP_0114545446 /NCGR_PEP_ID=MMETSP0114-20121206/3404_1 /TAXON_ID=31324 /ORGANISM="Goniomonas sp, Strain m" /LENGTH=46 /DNA_ID= /DNA_START= /DNA_END= /DNA_ORIENTATION=
MAQICFGDTGAPPWLDEVQQPLRLHSHWEHGLGTLELLLGHSIAFA